MAGGLLSLEKKKVEQIRTFKDYRISATKTKHTCAMYVFVTAKDIISLIIATCKLRITFCERLAAGFRLPIDRC
jgi:hypothetical protein